MLIGCRACGAENWLENQPRCFQCGAILRRCIDCGHYDRAKATCRRLNDGIDLHEAEHPSLLATSTNCQSYRPVAPPS